MATQGPMLWMDRALKKIADGTINLAGDTFHMALLGSAQALSATFTGSSGDARYADLTAELSTTNGYTNGGLALTGASLSRVAVNQTAWTTAAAQWTLTSTGITFKYAAIVDWTAANKDILAFVDMDTGGGLVSPGAGLFALNPDPANGWLYWSQ
jgi:hypothetical protein